MSESGEAKVRFIRVPPETKIIGRTLRSLRERACLSQRETARALGVTFQQIQKYESGANRLPIEKLYILKHYYDVPYARFFEGLEALREGVERL